MEVAEDQEITEKTVNTFLTEVCEDPAHLISELACESEYWEGVAVFVDENEYTALAELTPKQMAWLEKIRDGLAREEKKR